MGYGGKLVIIDIVNVLEGKDMVSALTDLVDQIPHMDQGTISKVADIIEEVYYRDRIPILDKWTNFKEVLNDDNRERTRQLLRSLSDRSSDRRRLLDKCYF
jgi:hypothetical protein